MAAPASVHVPPSFPGTDRVMGRCWGPASPASLTLPRGPEVPRYQGLKLGDSEELTAIKRDSFSSQVHSQFGMF